MAFTSHGPVETGLVVSLNHPDGNLTGIAILGAAIAAKRLDLLHKLVPATASIAILSGPTLGFNLAEAGNMRAAARVLGVHVLLLHAGTEREITQAFASLVEQTVGALLIGASVTVDAARDQITALAAHRIPTMFFNRSSVSAGALLSYGPDGPDANRQAGVYAGRILKGENPADLPVQQPTKYELVINLRTAKTLGLTMLPNMVAVADEVID